MKVGDIPSYNAGYHRGLNTEYHDVKWISDVRRPAREEISFVSFEKGYKDGLLDYTDGSEE
jgi:hypothetical protein